MIEDLKALEDIYEDELEATLKGTDFQVLKQQELLSKIDLLPIAQKFVGCVEYNLKRSTITHSYTFDLELNIAIVPYFWRGNTWEEVKEFGERLLAWNPASHFTMTHNCNKRFTINATFDKKKCLSTKDFEVYESLQKEIDEIEEKNDEARCQFNRKITEWKKDCILNGTIRPFQVFSTPD